MKRKDDGPGVPEAIPRTLQRVVDRLGVETVDRVWVFPPRIKGRRESGLVVVSRFAADGTTERRDLFTASYSAERTGKGLTVDWGLSEEGTAPPDRLPPVMEGVVRRAGDDEDQPREVGLGGDADAVQAFLGEWDDALLDPDLWPRAVAPEPDADADADSTPESGAPAPDAVDAAADPPDPSGAPARAREASGGALDPAAPPDPEEALA